MVLVKTWAELELDKTSGLGKVLKVASAESSNPIPEVAFTALAAEGSVVGASRVGTTSHRTPSTNQDLSARRSSRFLPSGALTEASTVAVWRGRRPLPRIPVNNKDDEDEPGGDGGSNEGATEVLAHRLPEQLSELL